MNDQTATTTEAKTEEVKTTKSIVPSKYSTKYKNGGNDELATFIKVQCTDNGNFNFDKFFELCVKNGVPQEKVDHYKAQVAEKRHGAEGRARMTLRNIMATSVRKEGKGIGLDGVEVGISLPKAVLAGAAAKAAEAAEAKA